MKRLLLFLLLSVPALAQFTTVTGTITDPNGIPYASGTISPVLVLPGGTSPTINGFPYSPPTQPTGLDATGAFTMRLADNAVLSPAATKWNFTVCSGGATVQPAIGKGPVCFSLASPLTITGTSQTITTQLTAAALALTVPISGGGGSLPVASAAGQVPVSTAAGTTYAAQAKLVVDVRDFSGGDWCAQVNAADFANAGVSAILNVPSAMSGLGACTTSISLTSGHALQFGKGTFDLGTQTGRAGILIGPAVSNVSIVGVGIGQTILQYTSANTGSGNGFPNGSAIGIGRVSGCANDAAASNYINIAGLSIVDKNTGSALASGHNPSGIDGACVNFLIIENNEFTDIKGNGAITVTGSFGGGGGNTYYNRNNIFDGTVAGGGGEFTADNSSNWTHYYVLNNTVSRWPCAFGVSRANEGLIANNTADMTLKAPFSACVAIGIGAGSDTSGSLGNVFAINNVVIMGFSTRGIALFPNSTLDYNTQLGIIGNNIHLAAGSSITGISINGVAAGHTPPALIVQNNIVSTDIPDEVTGALKTVEFSGNTFTGVTGNIPLFGCSGGPSIISGGSVRVHGNRISGPNPGAISTACLDASFATRQFQEWDNTIKDGNPNSYAAATGNLGLPASVSWTPGTIAANTSTANQVATVNQVQAGDSVKIVNANGGSTWLSLPTGVIASGYVSAANTITFNIANTTASPVTINSGNVIQSYVIVDRPPNNAQ